MSTIYFTGNVAFNAPKSGRKVQKEHTAHKDFQLKDEFQ